MASVAYQTLVEFRTATLMPDEFVDECEARYPGFIDNRLLLVSARIDSALAKRYNAPFQSPYPIAVCDWLTRIVTHDVWLKRGRASTDEDANMYLTDRDGAWADIKEAANSETGLFDLPARANTDESGIARGFPRGVAQQSPYAWSVSQARIGRSEDENAY